MSNEFDTEPDAAEMEELSRLLSSEAVWAEPSADVEDRVLAAIAEAGPGPAEAGPTEAGSGAGLVTDLDQRRADRKTRRNSQRNTQRKLWPLAAAAAVLVAILSAGALLSLNRTESSDFTVVAMAPTELAPNATATARVNERPNGVQLIIEIDGLDAAPEGSFYEVWLLRPEPRTAISAGTFHMRGSDTGEIEFWAGVSTEVYNVVTITLETEADPSAAGELVFRGEIAP